MIAIAVVLGLSFALSVQSARQVEYAAVSESSPVGDQNEDLSRYFDEIANKESSPIFDSVPVDDTAKGLSSLDSIARAADIGVLDDTAKEFSSVSDPPVGGDVDDSAYQAIEEARAFVVDGDATSQKVPAFEQMSKSPNANSVQQDIASSQYLREGVPGPIGYIYHRTSGKIIHPYGGSSRPRDDTPIVTYRGGAGQRRLQFRFIPVKGFGHYGFIEHVPSRAIIHPYGGRSRPWDDTHLVLHRGRHHGCLFTFDEENERIVHIGGKFWHPYRGQFTPPNDNRVVVHGGSNPAARFYLGDAYGRKISAYPTPNLSGTWRVLKAFTTPKVPITYTLTYKAGMTKTKTTRREHSWKVSVGAAYKLFSASAEYAGSIQHTSSTTWTYEKQESFKLNVPAGDTVVFWQFVYGMEQYGEGYTFKSDIIGTSNSRSRKPVLP